MKIERRKFLRDSCKACLLTGAGFLISDLTACSPASRITRLPIRDNTVRLPVTSFNKQSMQIFRPEGWIYDIAVRKTAGSQYEALLLQCTHQKNQLIADGNGFTCTLHGSRYTVDGQVKKGPSEAALKKFATRLEQDQLVIQLKS
jgi:nitrite reductase/ring-hydroxylating ferredoxin subunit